MKYASFYNNSLLEGKRASLLQGFVPMVTKNISIFLSKKNLSNKNLYMLHAESYLNLKKMF